MSNADLWRDLHQPLHEPGNDPQHSESCTPVNRGEGWYPADCERCEFTAQWMRQWTRGE